MIAIGCTKKQVPNLTSSGTPASTPPERAVLLERVEETVREEYGPIASMSRGPDNQKVLICLPPETKQPPKRQHILVFNNEGEEIHQAIVDGTVTWHDEDHLRIDMPLGIPDKEGKVKNSYLLNVITGERTRLNAAPKSKL